jgi:hypothetical protein
VFDYVLNKLKTNKTTEFEVWHEGKCGKCGRALTPSSILTGIGPECSKVIKTRKRDKLLTNCYHNGYTILKITHIENPLIRVLI